MEMVTLKMAEKWGCPPWDVDTAGRPCGHGASCPRNRRWMHYQLEVMELEGTYAS